MEILLGKNKYKINERNLEENTEKIKKYVFKSKTYFHSKSNTTVDK